MVGEQHEELGGVVLQKGPESHRQLGARVDEGLGVVRGAQPVMQVGKCALDLIENRWEGRGGREGREERRSAASGGWRGEGGGASWAATWAEGDAPCGSG